MEPAPAPKVRDVRMRGFAARADVEDVERFLAERAGALEAEEVALLECAGRVLAEDVRSEVDVPGFARAAMDGYAVRGEDTFGASDYDPLALRVLGEALPGRPFEGRVAPGEAVRIMTGAPVPGGADAVAMAEVCEERGGEVLVRDAVPPRRHVGAPGEDVRAGEVVLRAGRRLRPQDAGLLASIGAARVRCVRRPRARLVVTGDELLPAGARPEGARVVDSNSVVLRALVARDGGVALPFELLPDRPEAIRAALEDPEADVFLVSGGSSVGKEDFAPRLVAEMGRLDFHGVAMRPSSPAGVGRLPGAARERFVFLLPGNPVSCLCAYEFFAGPTLRRLGGRSPRWPHRRARLPLARKISSAVGRTDYVRVAIERGRVVPISTSGASILSSTVRADGFVIVPRALEGMPEGAEVEVLLYDDASGAEVAP
jgi:molybdopterin molybdotransferase